jgi:hypothetical protein
MPVLLSVSPGEKDFMVFPNLNPENAGFSIFNLMTFEIHFKLTFKLHFEFQDVRLRSNHLARNSCFFLKKSLLRRKKVIHLHPLLPGTSGN